MLCFSLYFLFLFHTIHKPYSLSYLPEIEHLFLSLRVMYKGSINTMYKNDVFMNVCHNFI